jgi:cyclic beta-1,2-glucan synthetase
MSISVSEPTIAPAFAPDHVHELLIDPRREGPIRAELFGLERLEEHARRLATVCTLAPQGRAASPLLREFDQNERVLVRVHRRIAEDIGRREDRGLDAEWLVDNFHIVEEVLREVRQDLPSGYDEKLPKLADPPARGYPRVHAVALSLVAHTDSELDLNRLDHFVEAFQSVAPLTIGELWALPTMLRLVLLENLRRLADQVLWVWDERQRAERWVAETLSPGKSEAVRNPELPVLTDAFLVRLIQIVRDQGTRSAPVFEALERRLAERGDDANEVLRREHQRQAANQISVGNCVISLRFLSAIDWNSSFEKHSLVDRILRDDPAGVYERQDFTTRDRYRRVVERISRGAEADEQAVAHRAVDLAHTALEQARGPARSHVGYYLVDRGERVLRDAFGYRPEASEALLDAVLAHPRRFYFGMLMAVWALLIGLLGLAGFAGRPLGLASGLLVVTALLIPASELAVGLVHHLLTNWLPPRVLPKLDFKEGIAEDCSTFVVMPSMLLRPQSAKELLGRLEIHALANPDPRLRFALLTDFADAPTEHAPEDEGYLQDALARVRALNERYAPEGPPKFYLFHRRRLWNPSENCWMGWERKRGKLSEFNRLLRGDRGTSYNVLSSDPGDLSSVRFVITLDSDTWLPRESARRLVGTLAHPLNQPRFDPEQGRVVEGYGVLQPRVSYHLIAATQSRFAGLLAYSAGIDPYATAVSDIYMDLFGVGSFTGKGIYDVAAFEEATGQTFPENRILSHDLIEGNYARCGLATDIELFDDFPARYHAYARREHRWVRGDWQLLPWLGPRVPAPEGRRANPLPTVERWKLLDNLRRSLVPPAVVLLLALGWTVLPGSFWVWTAIGLAVPALPIIQWLIGTLIGCVRNGSLSPLLSAGSTVSATLGQVAISIAFLANQAYLLVDATLRTLVRLFATRRRMLEWETAASTERRLGKGLRGFWVTMWPAPALTLAIALAVALIHPAALLAAAPILLAWFFSPVLAYWISQPKPSGELPLTEDERRALRRIARRTWSFFETYVRDADHWLPPDNMQEDEEGGRVAHRTSPTNQGLLLLSTLAAHDLGFIRFSELLERLERSFDTFDQLERHEGHFYNWYNTQTLKALPPRYISTVDSGNLLGSLLTLKHGLSEKLREPIVSERIREGLSDTFAIVSESLGTTPEEVRPIEQAIRAELDEASFDPGNLFDYKRWLAGLDKLASEWLVHFPISARALAQRFNGEIKARRAELERFAPWTVSAANASVSHQKTARAGSSPESGSTGGWEAVQTALVSTPTLSSMAARDGELLDELSALATASPGEKNVGSLMEQVRSSTAIASDLVARAERLAERADAFAKAMDFTFLYKADRHLFAIGGNMTTGKLDASCYDLLASEAALTSFLAVARGDAPRRHWFQLGRPFIRAAGRLGLLSWGGTMFEYLMPRLLLRSLAGTLLAEAHRTAVARQIEYGKENGIPWGISESAFSTRYADGDYQYQSFGVPGLGLKRGLERDLVVAPYATALAATVLPHEALENFQRLAAEKALGPFGFYEAIDYTPSRLPTGERSVIVRSYMAHHQGMSLIALTNALLDEPMPRRFHAEPMVRAVDLLLQERIPADAPIIEPSESGAAPVQGARETTPLLSRRLTTPATVVPRTHLVSNARYHVMLTNAGSGFSTCRGLAVTRWREDITCEDQGQFLYIRDLTQGHLWSAGHQPVGREADDFEVVFSTDKASFRRLDSRVETLFEVTVSPEHLAEIRQVTLLNRDDHPRDLELTSYAEIVLAPQSADLAHPAFHKLFLETEWIPSHRALLCRRRPRAHDHPPIWAVHVAAFDASTTSEVEFETDRARFLGRGRRLSYPFALDLGVRLSGTTGPVLDPIMSLRLRVHLEPGASAVVAFTTGLADSRDEALALADQYGTPSAISRAFDMAWAQSLIEHRHRSWSPENAHLYQRLASPLIYAGSAMRAAPEVLAENRQGQPGLWKHGISGDRPILLARLSKPEELSLVGQLLDAHAYLRRKGLDFDLVFLNDQPASYQDELLAQIRELVRSSDDHDLVEKPGGVFIWRAAILSGDDQDLLLASARVVLHGDRGPLAGQLDRIERRTPLPERLVPALDPPARPAGTSRTPDNLLFPNGLGGFTPDGREYVILVRGTGEAEAQANGRVALASDSRPSLPPAPWINVIANPACGFLISESGAGYTWAGNSQANRLTPWSNDPIADPHGEALYLRDEETGEVWTPTPLPIPSQEPTVVRHGQGYTVFERETRGLAHVLTLFVPPDDPVKLIRLSVQNMSDRPRSLSATYYTEWVLGTVRDVSAMHVVTEIDPETGALIARSAFRNEYAAHLAFADVDRRPSTFTADRAEFLGRLRTPETPEALGRIALSGRVGGGFDPCAAIQTQFHLKPGESTEITFFLGEADSREALRQLLQRYREPGAVVGAMAAVKGRWDALLGAVQVKTPNPGMDLLLNRWLVYQVTSCRLWGRSAFYQSGGAYGFRDQLQDVMALVYGAPGEARAHLLRAAARQFVEGDVQHWWHPPLGRGVRTHFSDDLLWLPFVVVHYVSTTGDFAVLDEPIPFLEAPPLSTDVEDAYGVPSVSSQIGTLYEHCTRALDRGYRLGAHGLPLMGSGDWNDGMNRVGFKGKGESVWDAWFLLAILQRFSDLAERKGDTERAGRCREQAEALRGSVEKAAWDGDWYRRAYFDDGTPLGSAENDECQIDSIAQTWALISGAGDLDRSRKAMGAVEEKLIRSDDGLILLFTPPFDRGKLEPGYIKGYVPGIRENGGQYTHAATWVVLAEALVNRGRRAVNLFDLLNPIHHADSPEKLALYKVEPYVVAADVYGRPPHTGRGGWTWYTGSASWFYRVALEAILGFQLQGDRLLIDPCIPGDWPGFELVYRHRSATYRVVVENPDGVERDVRSVSVDGVVCADRAIPLADDAQEHQVRVVMGR